MLSLGGARGESGSGEDTNGGEGAAAADGLVDGTTQLLETSVVDVASAAANCCLPGREEAAAASRSEEDEDGGGVELKGRLSSTPGDAP